MVRWDSLLHLLENVEVEKAVNLEKARFPIQYVIRPQTEALHDYRGYAGKRTSGIFRRGDKVAVLPSGLHSVIKNIEVDGGRQVEEAFAPQSIVLHLEDDIDISRGDVIVQSNEVPETTKELEVLLCWMDNKPLVAGNKYLLQMNSTRVRSVIKDIEFKLDVNSLEKHPAPEKVGLNDIVKAVIKTSQPVVHDSYKALRTSGGAILIDETSNVTVGACMIQ